VSVEQPTRVVLFLQGPPSGFWNDLARAVCARGGGVRRVNLCLADQLFWRAGPSVCYRGGLRAWRHWLRAFIARERVTDIVYYADRLPYHRIARAVARRTGIAAHAVEFGYLRPDWLTFERGGNGAFSTLDDRADALARAAPPPDMKARYGHPFWREALGEVIFNLAMVAGRPLFPKYAMDKPIHPVPDYLAWLWKIARTPWRRRVAARTEREIRAGGPYWLVGLQLPVDYQLRDCATYPDQRDMVRAVIRSFAAHALPGDALVFKAHPLDNGWIDWAGVARREAALVGIADRVHGIDGGDLYALLRGCRGVVVATSTVGLHALRVGRPVKTLGGAIYDVPGLTDQRALECFWRSPAMPDRQLVSRLVATLAEQVQVRGSIFHGEGRLMAAATMAERLMTGSVGPRDPIEPPPRAAATRRRRLLARRG
jgi:capsular polysaccharide export protein